MLNIYPKHIYEVQTQIVFKLCYDLEPDEGKVFLSR
jgi:hypothetical protein